MTVPTTPYTPELAGRDPLVAMQESEEHVRALAGAARAEWFDRSYAPGKWSARQVLIHLAQTEMAIGSRARLAVSIPAYVAQPFDQDVWMARELGMSGP